MKKLIIAILCLCLIAGGFTGCTKADDTDGKDDLGGYIGTVTVALDREAAPITVDNFVKLANEGFYDGLTFHRIIDGFMMQGGDPEGTGGGGSDETIKGEFSANGVDNPLSHTEGAISMARNSISMDSASSQFFIVHEDSTFLDGEYACFGYVTEGMSIVDKICKNAENTDSNGSVPENKRPIIKSINIREAEISGITYADIVIDYSAVM